MLREGLEIIPKMSALALDMCATASATENDPIPAKNSATVDATIGLFLVDFESGDTSVWE